MAPLAGSIKMIRNVSLTCSSNSLSEALCWQSATTDMKRLSLFKASRVDVRSASWWRMVLVVLKMAAH